MKKLMKIFSLILVALISVSLFRIETINCFFQDEENITEELLFGNVETEILEDNDTKIIIPGDEFKKTVTVKNIGISPCYVRVKILISPEKYENELNLNINTVDWEYIDGFYYYKTVLNHNEESSPLFTKLTIPAGLTEGDYFDVNIYSESIQYIVYDDDKTILKNYTETFQKITKIS